MKKSELRKTLEEWQDIAAQHKRWSVTMTKLNTELAAENTRLKAALRRATAHSLWLDLGDLDEKDS